jgi:hypothetical protein
VLLPKPELYLRGASPQPTQWSQPMDEVDDWLIEDILDLLNDALGG